jgi:hypothetical protein
VGDVLKRSREIINLVDDDDDDDEIVFLGSKRNFNTGKLSNNNGSNDMSGDYCYNGISSSCRIGYVSRPNY